MNSNNQVEIDVPDAYGGKKKFIKEMPDPKIDDIPVATNKVRKIVIKGVLKHDSSSN